tara:strand:- start:11 stop:748 length:738 start_codon:yes stop_codon:yes gene_type:complete
MEEIQHTGGGDEEPKPMSVKNSFMKHVFTFDLQTKNELTNLIQYGILGLIPIIVLNKILQRYIPQIDESKGSLEILFEIVIQVVIILVGVYYAHRLVTFIPTVSGAKYLQINLLNVVLILLVLGLTVQTKLGEKMHLLADRALGVWNGDETIGIKEGMQEVKVSQPISNGGGMMNQMVPMHQPSRADNLQMGNPPPQPQLTSVRSEQDQNTINNAVGGNGMNGQGMVDMYEPMAANEGSGMFSHF